MDVYLAPASVENLEKSILNPIDKKILKTYLEEIKIDEINNIYKDKEIKCWGMSCGSKQYLGYFNSLKMGDYIVFTPKGTGKFKYIGKIVYKLNNKYIGKALWDFETTLPWKYIMFIDEVEEIDIDKKELIILLGYNENFKVPGLTKLDEIKKEKFLEYIGKINEEKVIYNKDMSKINDENIDKLLKEYEGDITGTIIKNIPEFRKKNTVQNKKIKNDIRQISKLISSRNAKIIGILGEKVVYETLRNNIDGLLNILNIKQSNIKNIEWYNLELYNKSLYMKKDNSKGKGHDIKVITRNSEEFLIEVKSSYGSGNQISLTNNEIKAMNNNRNYYIFIVENLKNRFIGKLPTIRIVEGFNYNIPNEMLSSISEISIYKNSDLINYHTVF